MVTNLVIKEKFNHISIDIWHFVPWVLSFILIGPVICLFITATGDSEGLWNHLYQTVLIKYILNTIKLMIGVSITVLIFGVGTAWLVSRYEFTGRKVFDWMLMLPAACPAYLVAYAYTDFFEYAGPVQSLLRNFFGWKNGLKTGSYYIRSKSILDNQNFSTDVKNEKKESTSRNTVECLTCSS